MITYQRFKFLGSNEIIFRDEIIEMLVTGVDVCFDADRDKAIKMMNVDVDKDTEQPGQDLFTDGNEVLGERNVSLAGEDVFGIDLPFDPVHEVRHILNSW